MNENLLLEAEAFNRQIVERVKNGHIPDLRYTEKCEYFYNNVWRHPDFVQMDFGEIFQLLQNAVRKHIQKEKPEVLEVGCGPGYLSLELARNGLNVTGIELSGACIEIAKQFAEKDPHKSERGKLDYITGDFFSDQHVEKKFDAVIFVGALHHFPDQRQLLKRVGFLLNEDGIIIAHEPTRDRVEKRNAAIYQLVKTLVSLAGGYYQDIPVYNNVDAIERDVNNAFLKMKYEEESGEKLQSVNDNSAGHKEMITALKSNFDQLDYQERYAFFHELIGGLRFTDEKNKQMAQAIKLFDKYLCESGVIQSSEFFFVGRKK